MTTTTSTTTHLRTLLAEDVPDGDDNLLADAQVEEHA